MLNFCMNVLSAVGAYCFFDKKPALNMDYSVEMFDGQLTLFN